MPISPKGKTVKKSGSKKVIESAESTEYPELIFGLVGPIGVDLDEVVDALTKSLEGVGYTTHTIHLTKLMKHNKVNVKIDTSSYYHRYLSLIRYANSYRALLKNPRVMAGIAISKIRQIRESETGSATLPSAKTAYLVRQFKRPEEIEVMRLTYGRKFFQLSVYASEAERREVLIQKIKDFDASPKDDATCEKQAIDLINRDYNEGEVRFGQRVGGVFHLGDAFINGIGKKDIESTLDRLICAFFGDNGVSPTRDEYGMYIANSTSLRSVDLSRQVGAAIFTKAGEIVAMGCNEVPKPFGGTYWGEGPPPPCRDYELGKDANEYRRDQILFDFIRRLSESKLLSASVITKGSLEKQVRFVRDKKRIRDSQVMDILEFGRMIHAEMSAITDAARLGRPTVNSILFSTAFPCHMCAKHVVSSGIRRVVFLEPYPKSYAEDLHGDSITFDSNDSKRKVLFEPFIGISPRRYQDIFEKKGKRKEPGGSARKWYEGDAKPRVEDKSTGYIDNEESSVAASLRRLQGAVDA